jgi:ubiquinone/menaquinone biosynthesis C-methylase UbiE
MELMAPSSADLVLDVGVTDTAWRSSNPLEAAYPWPERITAVGLEPMPTFQKLFPAVGFVVADGRNLPFADKSFDIGYSNAVVEHVGSLGDQRQFVSELLRTCRRVSISTPNAHFPIDPHTLLPFVHWLPRGIRHPILRATGNGRWASESVLRPISPAELRSMFPREATVRIVRQRALGLTTVLTAIAGEALPKGG